MQHEPLHNLSIWKRTLVLCTFLFITYCVSAQTESSDFITYDTTINYTCFADQGGCVVGGVPSKFILRISRPRNYFVAGNADTASRPWILTMPGAGEVSSDTNKLVLYGPHYWLQHGWDGGVQLGNGKHFPILVTVITSVSTFPVFIQAMMDTIIRRYHPRGSSLHLAALSEGVYYLGGYMEYERTAGDEHNMANVRSFTDLQGENPGDYPGASPYTYISFWGHWAKKYGGRFFGLEGSQDSRSIWQDTQNMNDSLPGSAYFCYDTIGGGHHGFWNQMYDPSITNWQDTPVITNTYLQYSTNPKSTMGSYKVNPTTGANIFQWMLRQGDTTLIPSGSPVNILPVANAGPDKNITLPLDSVVVTGTGTDADGTIASYAWTKASGTGGTISSPSTATTTFKGLTAGTYKFVLTVTDNLGGTGKDTMQVTVDTAAWIPPTVTAGPDKTDTLPTDSVVCIGSATAHGTTIHAITWTRISGPNTPTIVTSNSAQTATIHGLIQGTYLFSMTALDNHGLSATDSVTVTVLAAFIPPTVTAGPDKTDTLPTDSVVCTGNATAHGTTIHAITWTKISGPNTPTVVTSNSSQTATLHGLIQGTYIYSITALDNHGLSATDSVTITVYAAPAGAAIPLPIVAPGEYQVFFIDSTKHLYAIGSNLVTLGVGGTGTPGTTLPVAIPSLKFRLAAGGLHGGAAVDTTGALWSWGDDDQGQVGNGTVSTSQVLTPVKITTDSAGNTFTGITALAAYFTNNASEGWYAIKSDSTLWVWGQTLNGMRGNGTTGSTANSRPVQVPVPGSRKVVQIVGGDHLIVLCSDSTVWTCGGATGNPQNLGYAATSTTALSLQQLTTLSGITQIAGGGPFNYALRSNGTLYGWGYYGYYMGGTGGTNSPLATPTDLTTRLNLAHPIRSIAVNMQCTHVILSDSTLWGWGDNAQGGIGNGQELNFATTTDPYAWDFGAAELLQQAPVQVTTRHDFVAIYSTYVFVMYNYAVTAGRQIYSWGRNKGAVLGNGIVGCSSDVVGKYPNSWDITTPTLVNPLSVATTTVGPCPYCVLHPDSVPCNTCTTGSRTGSVKKTGTAAALQTDPSGHIPDQFQVYPSISQDNDLLHMTIASDNNGAVKVRICDLNGHPVKTLQFDKKAPLITQSVSVGYLPAGMYIVQALIGDHKQFTAKFIRL